MGTFAVLFMAAVAITGLYSGLEAGLERSADVERRARLYASVRIGLEAALEQLLDMSRGLMPAAGADRLRPWSDIEVSLLIIDLAFPSEHEGLLNIPQITALEEPDGCKRSYLIRSEARNRAGESMTGEEMIVLSYDQFGRFLGARRAFHRRGTDKLNINP